MASYDQRFKVFLGTFLERFLLTYWPEITPRLRLETLRLLPLDLYADPPTGDVRAVDVLAEVRTVGDTEELIALHVDVQGQPLVTFPRRMWEYYCLLTLRHNRPVLPVALLLYPPSAEEQLAWGHYTTVVAGEEIARFRYRQIALRALPAEAYLPGAGAVGAALGLLMSPGPTLSRPELYIACIQHIMAAEAGGEVNAAEAWLLGEMLLAYGDLTEGERALAHQVAARRPEGRDIMATEGSWFRTQVAEAERRGIEQGIKQGIEQSIEQSREMIREIALVRFGVVPAGLAARLAQAHNEEDLRLLARAVAAAPDSAALG